MKQTEWSGQTGERVRGIDRKKEYEQASEKELEGTEKKRERQGDTGEGNLRECVTEREIAEGREQGRRGGEGAQHWQCCCYVLNHLFADLLSVLENPCLIRFKLPLFFGEGVCGTSAFVPLHKIRTRNSLSFLLFSL